MERAAEHPVEGEPVDRFPQRQRCLKGGGVRSYPVRELVAFGDPAFEVSRPGQGVNRLVPSGPDGAGQVEGRGARLATAAQRLPAWSDSVAGLDRLAQHYAVVGLSNAGRTALLRLNAHAGLRWHQALSAETVQAYKPTPAVYQLANNIGRCPPERMLMVAAHAWDLRGAQANGMRTAYVDRPGADQPATSDVFDWRHERLDDLVTALTAGA